MKNIISLFVLFLFFSSGALSQNTAHLGVWEHEEEGEILRLTLDNRGIATIHVDGEVMGGKPTKNKYGDLIWAEYQIDYNSSPKSIVIALYTDFGGELVKDVVYGLFEFHDDGQTMRLMLNFDYTSVPTEFDEENTDFFKKVK